ncbi:START-like domain [Ceraceosorus bombacis]|uniref:START-like domain n=1 Tax=Ceraceosorus bombacis TaxID=401625 RepID=A0A0P1BKI5_9BASI|nr:START-like domain [Ceraceosorus bombacis]
MTVASPFRDLTATPNQPLSRVVFTSGTRVRIAAPKEVVWRGITALEEYAEWNSTMRSFELDGAALREGAQGKMKWDDGSGKPMEVPELITKLEDDTAQSTLAWQGLLLPSWLGIAERVQTVSTLPEEGGAACMVTNWESMSGPFAWIGYYLLGLQSKLDQGNATYCHDLKSRCEEIWRRERVA